MSYLFIPAPAFKLFVFGVLLAIASKTEGQSHFNRAVHDNDEKVYKVLTIGQEFYFFTVNQGRNGRESVLYKYNSAGSLIERRELKNFVLDALVGKNNNLVIAAREVLCDYFPPVQKHFLLDLDKDLDTISTREYHKNFCKLVLLADSNYMLLFERDSLEILNKNFVTIKDTSYSMRYVHDAAEMASGNVLVSHSTAQMQSQISLLSKSGNLILTVNTPVLLDDLKKVGSQQWGRSGGKIYRISANLSQIDDTGLSDVIDYVNEGDTIFALTKSSSEPPKYKMLLNPSFQELYSSSITTPSLIPKRIFLHNSGVIIASDGHSYKVPSYTNYDQFFASFNIGPRRGNFNCSADVELLAAVQDSIRTDTLNGHYIQTSLRPAIQVRNNGPLLTSLALNCLLRPRICGSYFYQYKFTNLSIPAGQTQWLVPDDFIPLNEGSLGKELCFHLTVPNSEIDNNQTDNSSCFIVTSIKKKSIEAVTVILAPNPVQNELHIESEYPLTALEVLSLQGQLLHLKSNDLHSIDLSDLAEGIYLLKVKTMQGTTVRKIIKN